MNEHLSPLFRINYRLQRSDHVARVIALTRRPLGRTVALAAGYYGLLFMFLLFQADGPGEIVAAPQSLMASPALFAALPWLLLGLLLLLPPSFYGAMLGGLAYQRSGLSGAEITIDVTAGGLVTAVADRVSRVAWPVVTRLIETPDYLFLQLSRREALIIPRRAIGDPADYQNLVGFIRARTGLSTRR
ncbi:MAG TPA: YcxB family protein [Devosiaceae bacterium]|jgi:hypothetical protein|nr:YcxB family protein [Devosiaceae bacterium]